MRLLAWTFDGIVSCIKIIDFRMRSCFECYKI